VIEWLDEQEERPLFLWVHYYDPHWPHEAPEDYRIFEADDALDRWLDERGIPRRVFRKKLGESEVARESHDGYDAELRYLDHNLEQLFKRLRQRARWPRTATLIVGDHGEALCQHGRTGHGWTWNEQVQAPMLLKLPGETPRRVPWTVSVVDGLPTLLGRLPVPELDAFLDQARGRDVLAPDFQATPVLSQDTGVRIEHPGAKVYHYALTSGRWKLIRIESKLGEEERGGRPGVRYRLYDRIADPFELADLSETMPDLVGDLDGRLSAILADQRRHGELLGGGRRREVRADDELIRKMTDLGYMDGLDDEDGGGEEPSSPADDG
jgi:arylsulfatase A-like enzyme